MSSETIREVKLIQCLGMSGGLYGYTFYFTQDILGKYKSWYEEEVKEEVKVISERMEGMWKAMIMVRKGSGLRCWGLGRNLQENVRLWFCKDARREAGGRINENVYNKRHVKEIRDENLWKRRAQCQEETWFMEMRRGSVCKGKQEKYGNKIIDDGRWMEGYWK